MEILKIYENVEMNRSANTGPIIMILVRNSTVFIVGWMNKCWFWYLYGAMVILWTFFNDENVIFLFIFGDLGNNYRKFMEYGSEQINRHETNNHIKQHGFYCWMDG